MMQSMKRFVQAGFMAGLLAAGAAQARVDPLKPAPTAESDGRYQRAIAAHRKLGATSCSVGIDARRAEFRKDPDRAVRARRPTRLLPHFDTPYAAQLVLGQHWRNATPEQRKRFVDAFYKSLLYTYGDAMVDFTGDRLEGVARPRSRTPTNAGHGAHRDQALQRHQGRASTTACARSTASGKPGTWSSTASAT